MNIRPQSLNLVFLSVFSIIPIFWTTHFNATNSYLTNKIKFITDHWTKGKSYQMEELCDNGSDDDGDGKIDIFDEDCQCLTNVDTTNLVLNGDFEEKTENCCTRSMHGEDICVNHWSHKDGTPDLVTYDCIINTERALYDVPLEGTFFGLLLRYLSPREIPGIGLKGGYSNETIGTCLHEPLQAGQAYNISIDVGLKGQVNQPIVIDDDFFLTINGITDCNSLSNYSTIKDDFCTLELPYEKLAAINLFKLQGGWNKMEFEVIPTTDINAIFFNGDCQFIPETSKNLIAVIDNIKIQKINSPRIPNEIKIDGGACEEFMRLTVQGAENLAIHWYKDSIPLIRTTGGSLLFTPQMKANATGTYHAKVTFEDGTCQLVGPLHYEIPMLSSELSAIIAEGEIYNFGDQNLTTSGTYTNTVQNNFGCDSLITLTLTVIPDNSEICNNGIDDDGDGQIDVFDPDCSCQTTQIDPTNLVPNSNFDRMSGTCRLGIFDVNSNSLADWSWVSGNPDFHNTSCNQNFRVESKTFQENFLGIAFSGNAMGGDSEAMGTCLNSPLIPNQKYQITLKGVYLDHVKRDDTPILFTIYGVKDCAVLNNDFPEGPLGFCAQNIEKEAIFSFLMDDFTPGNNESIAVMIDHLPTTYTGIILAGNCEQVHPQNSASYFAIDYLKITPTVEQRNWEYSDTISMNGSWCDEAPVKLFVPEVDSLNYQWYQDSVPILNATTHTLNIDPQTVIETLYFHLNVSNQQGNCQLLSFQINLPTIYTEIEETFCEGDTLFFGQQIIYHSGIYRDTLATTNGCDSIITLIINQLPNIIGDTLNIEQPDGTTYNFQGRSYKNEGIYQANLIAENGCDSLVWLNLSFFDPCINTMSITPETADPTCAIAQNGWIDLMVAGGTPPYQFSIDGGVSFSSNPLFENLSAKAYSLIIKDANNCESKEQITLQIANNPLLLELPSDTILKLGQRIELGPQNLNFLPIAYEWISPTPVNCPTCVDIILLPIESGNYQLTATDEYGCQASDEIFIEVKKAPQLYVPNVFSPNGDGQNDYFQVAASTDLLEKVVSLQIFNRWGNLIFQQTKSATNSFLAWDGTYQQQPVAAGTYIYSISWLAPNGRTERLKGDVQLVR